MLHRVAPPSTSLNEEYCRSQGHLKPERRKASINRVRSEIVLEDHVTYRRRYFCGWIAGTKIKGSNLSARTNDKVGRKIVNNIGFHRFFVLWQWVHSRLVHFRTFALVFFLPFFLLCALPSPCLFLQDLLFTPNAEDFDRSVVRLNSKVR